MVNLTTAILVSASLAHEGEHAGRSIASGLPPGVTSNNQLALAILLFTLVAVGFVAVTLQVGKLLRPTRYHPEKAAAYECGEPAIGEGWMQFDLRFYTVALVFIVFDVEIALLWPWAVAFKGMLGEAFWPFLVFFLLIAIPFVYEWSSGYLDWVRAATGQRGATATSEQ